MDVQADRVAVLEAAGRRGPHPDRDDVLVGTAWLLRHLHDPQVRVVEVDVSAAGYDAGHIDGAVLWNVYADLRDADYHLVDAAAVQALLERSGIAPDTTVVLYGYAPALGFWLLKRYGHRSVRLLDADAATWRRRSGPWSTQPATPAASRYPRAEPDPTLFASQADVRAAIGDPHRVLLDVRTGEEFRGERFWPSGAADPTGRAGHVPGAVHLPLDDCRDHDGAFLGSARLAQRFAGVDLGAAGEVITYCTIGGRAATAWFVLSHLLQHANVRVYEGSWAEWGHDPTAPVER